MHWPSIPLGTVTGYELNNTNLPTIAEPEITNSMNLMLLIRAIRGSRLNIAQQEKQR
jgi:hypothetical protein